MIAVDTNILVHAHRTDSIWHVSAAAALEQLAMREPWAIPWPCVYEFFNTVTHPRVFRPSSTSAQAIAQLDVWMSVPTLSVLSETSTAWPSLRDLLRNSKVIGPVVHDARIASICIQHGVSELWSCDRDFSRFPDLRVVNPLVPATAVRERRGRYRTAR